VVLADDTAALLETGSALIVGTVASDGEPHALRGWGADVIGRDPCRVRVLIDAHEETAIADLAAGRPVAMTAADVVSLWSVQVKGTSLGVEPARAGDDERVSRYVEAFFHDIETTDGTPRVVLDRLVPDTVVAFAIEVTEVYDQTPGPDAGRAVARDEEHG
jgi:hypothetical protein